MAKRGEAVTLKYRLTTHTPKKTQAADGLIYDTHLLPPPGQLQGLLDNLAKRGSSSCLYSAINVVFKKCNKSGSSVECSDFRFGAKMQTGKKFKMLKKFAKSSKLEITI